MKRALSLFVIAAHLLAILACTGADLKDRTVRLTNKTDGYFACWVVVHDGDGTWEQDFEEEFSPGEVQSIPLSVLERKDEHTPNPALEVVCERFDTDEPYEIYSGAFAVEPHYCKIKGEEGYEDIYCKSWEDPTAE